MYQSYVSSEEISLFFVSTLFKPFLLIQPAIFAAYDFVSH